MGVGLGIHGEPGIYEAKLPRAADLAQMLVDGVLAETPADPTRRVAAILNGLGSTKYEELFVVWRTVATLLAEAGYVVVEPEVGELVTSLDMAGCSLTLVYLDDELEQLWKAPADTPAYRKGSFAAVAGTRRVVEAVETQTLATPASSPASRSAAATALRALQAMAAVIDDAAEELGRIDAVAGDGDHGRGMLVGVVAAVEAAHESAASGAGVGSLLAASGDAWAGKAGGTSGVLWGAALRAVGQRLGDTAPEVRALDVADAVREGLVTVQNLGKAEMGDKTMVDALVPFVAELHDQVADGTILATAWTRAADVADRAAQETASLRPRIGRARPLAERSVGTPDAGAISLALCLRSIATVLGTP
jgi:dihydroxyacetone kinase